MSTFLRKSEEWKVQASIAVVLATISCWYFHRHIRKGRNEPSYPPGPKGHFLLGNALELPDQKKNEVMEVKLLEWATEYGLCYTISIPIVGKMIVISDPEIIQKMLFTYNKYPKSHLYKVLIPIAGERALALNGGEEWAKMRKAFNPGFAPSFLKDMVTVVEDKLTRFIDVINDDIDNDKPTNMLKCSQNFTSDVIVAIAFGEDWGGSKPHPAHEWVNELSRRCLRFAFDPFLQLFGFSEWREVKRYEKLIDQEMMNLLERRLAVIDSIENKKDICSIAVELLKQSDGSLTIDDKISITHQLKSFYFGGFDTTSSTIAWAVWLMSQNEHVLEKVRAELKEQAIWPSLTTPPTYDQLLKCVYLEAVIKETLRFYPPVTTVTRVATDPMDTCAGFRVGGAIIALSMFVTHRHPKLWNEPEIFRPERFLDGSEDNIAAKFFPFSRGPHDCIGKHFATLEAKVALSAIATRYDLKCVDPNEDIKAETTLKPKNGAQVKFSHRSQ